MSRIVVPRVSTKALLPPHVFGFCERRPFIQCESERINSKIYISRLVCDSFHIQMVATVSTKDKDTNFAK